MYPFSIYSSGSQTVVIRPKVAHQLFLGGSQTFLNAEKLFKIFLLLLMPG